MSEDAVLLVDAATRLFAQFAQESDRQFTALWPRMQDMGIPLLLASEAHGGIAASVRDCFAVARAAGYTAVALPVPECIIGYSAYAATTDDPDDGLTTVASELDGTVADGRCTGVVRAVPWGRHSARIVLCHLGRNLLVHTGDARNVESRENPAGEPRDTLVFQGAPVVDTGGASVFTLGALLRVAQIAGALEACLEMSVRYANERVQFGRSIGKFQVIQHNLAMFAEESAAALAAGEAAARAAEFDAAAFEVAAAKCRANKAAAFGHATAHAVHGAIGFTAEYPLNHLTRRLLGWRSEFGGASYWASWLGGRSVEMSRDGFWAALTARSDEVGRAREPDQDRS